MGTVIAELVDSGEKRDSSGRKLVGDARREAVLEAYDRTELTQRAFAEREGVSYHTLVTWLGRRRQEQRNRPALPAPVRFREVKVPRGLPMVEVCLPTGVIVRGSDGAQIAALVKLLAR